MIEKGKFYVLVGPEHLIFPAELDDPYFREQPFDTLKEAKAEAWRLAKKQGEDMRWNVYICAVVELDGYETFDSIGVINAWNGEYYDQIYDYVKEYFDKNGIDY